jgi:predicted metal-dependent enzyme (double-stranded beta helix superfamily)
MLQSGIKFDVDQFVANCRARLSETTPQEAVREVVARAISDPASVLRGLGEPKRAEVQRIYCSSELTILNVIWAPRMVFMPHNHAMWAIIGVYTGREDNIFWRRISEEPGGRIEAAGAGSIGERQAMPLGRDIIHSVTNPTSRLTGAIHVYGGDFFGANRSEWDPETLSERPCDVEKNMRLFEEANALLASG